MQRMIRSEWLKLRRSVVWLLLLISPGIAAAAGFIGFRGAGHGGTAEAFPWMSALAVLSAVHAMLFLPLLTGVYAALVCRFEHAHGGWKQLLALPVSRTNVYVVKYGFVMLLLALTQLLFLLGVLAVGLFYGGWHGSIPWGMLLHAVLRGWLACLPLAALQLAVSTAWASFAAPLALNVILTMPNLLVVNSATYGPYDPWALPMLAMLPADPEASGGAVSAAFGQAFYLPASSLYGVMLGGLVAFGLCGWLYFQRKAV